MGRIGMLFQQARIEQGYTLGEVADALNIDVRYIFDLEDEDYKDLPGKTFTIGYAKSYARFLGLNPNRITDEIAKEIGYEPIYQDGDFVEQQLLGSEDKAEERRRELERFAKRSKKNRQQMVIMGFMLLVLFVLAFFGSRTWI